MAAWLRGGVMAGGGALPAQIWALLGPIWVWVGLACAFRRHLRRTEVWLGLGVAETVARVLQRSDGSFTSPLRARPGRGAWFAPELRPVGHRRGWWRLSLPTWPLTLLLLVFGWFLSIPPVSLRLSQ